MGIQRTIWLASIVAIVSAAVSVATVCVVLPRVVSNTPSTEPTPVADSDIKHETLPELAGDDPRAAAFAAEQDREAIDAIKQGLDINVFSGTVFEDTAAVEEPPATTSAEQIASRALAATAERLRADGQPQAAELVRAAASHLRSDPVRAASAEQPTKSR